MSLSDFQEMLSAAADNTKTMDTTLRAAAQNKSPRVALISLMKEMIELDANNQNTEFALKSLVLAGLVCTGLTKHLEDQMGVDKSLEFTLNSIGAATMMVNKYATEYRRENKE